MKAVVTAGGRIDGTPLGELTGQSLKCLLEFDGRRLLDHVLDALHATAGVDSVCVVAPESVREHVALAETDVWVDDTGSGPGNFLAGIRACADQERIIFSTSDLPFLEAPALEQLLALCPAGYGVHFPIFSRDEVRARFPKEANSYMRLREGDMSGTSVMVIEPRRVLDREAEIDALFHARKDFLKLARFLGPDLCIRLALSTKLKLRLLSVDQIVRRCTKIAGFPVNAVRGCDPSLCFDVDHERDWNEALAHLDGAA